MDLNFTDEQRLLAQSVERFVAQRYDYAARARILAGTERFSGEVWSAMAEFGWLALPQSERDGGLGGSTVDAAIIAEGLGRGLVLEPYLSCAVLAAGLVGALGDPAQRAAWLRAIADGRARLALAHAEPAAGMLDGVRSMRAERDGEGWRLDGIKTLVVDGPGADAWLVSARTAGEAMCLFIVPRGTVGVDAQPFEMIDGRLGSRLAFDGAHVPDAARLGTDGSDVQSALAAMIDRTAAVACAEAVGCMQAAFETTVAYSKTRVQFGQPIGANQVLKHRMVDMATQCDEARSMALRAALYCDGANFSAAERARAVSGACLKIARGARFVAESAIQLHGAMGMTEELSVGAYLKRLIAFECWPATASEHLARCMATRNVAAATAI
ncbi:MAG: acyl-CoA dehydrogenase [Burkholderiaceae bacterium]